MSTLRPTACPPVYCLSFPLPDPPCACATAAVMHWPTTVVGVPRCRPFARQPSPSTPTPPPYQPPPFTSALLPPVPPPRLHLLFLLLPPFLPPLALPPFLPSTPASPPTGSLPPSPPASLLLPSSQSRAPGAPYGLHLPTDYVGHAGIRPCLVWPVTVRVVPGWHTMPRWRPKHNTDLHARPARPMNSVCHIVPRPGQQYYASAQPGPAYLASSSAYRHAATYKLLSRI